MPRPPRPHRQATTLFEVAVALLLVSVAVTAALLVFPGGLKAQQLARFRLLAAVKAEEIVDLFANAPNDNAGIDSEAFQPWDVPVSYRVFAPDIESRVASAIYGVMPVPETIARRLDSDGDEIARVLDDGACLYFSQATPIGQMKEDLVRATQDPPPSDAQRLVFAVVGAAQQNAMFSFPWKAWPYYAHYPSPPMHGAFLTGEYGAANQYEFIYPTQDLNACFEGSFPSISPVPGNLLPGVDPDIRVVFSHRENGLDYGFKPYAYDNAPDINGAIRYVQAALWYCDAKGLMTWVDPTATSPVPLADFPLPDSVVPHWQQVDALRFLAHAALCITRWADLAALGGQPSNPGTGFLIPTVTLAGRTLPDVRLTHDKIVFLHESCLALAMKYAAEEPYDWGAPRPIQRAIMTDYPLIQYDLFSPPLSGHLFERDEVSGTIAAEQWRPIPAQPIRNLGVSWTFPDRAIGPADYAAPNGVTIWGDPTHFTLTAPFSPAERCRELVFWAVDWLAYEDCETAPSAPVDASRYSMAGPLRGKDFHQRMDWNDWWERHLRDSRNPERNLLFTSSVAGLPTGSDVSGVLLDYFGPTPGDKTDPAIFAGRYGADRNSNLRLDRGPVSASTRMRAIQVARFNLYDPRVPAVLR